MTPGEMDRLESVFEKEAAVSEVMLYGSRAKGTHRPRSDIDLTLTGSKLSTRWLMELSGKSVRSEFYPAFCELEQMLAKRLLS